MDGHEEDRGAGRVTPNLHKRGRGYVCRRCNLAAGRTRRLATERAAFQHLLWHRDAGDRVRESELTAMEGALDDPTLSSTDAVSLATMFAIHGRESVVQGTYGCDEDGKPIRPQHYGRARPGRITVRDKKNLA